MRTLRLGARAIEFMAGSSPETRKIVNRALAEIRDGRVEDLTKRPSIRRDRYWFESGGFLFLLALEPRELAVLEITRRI